MEIKVESSQYLGQNIKWHMSTSADKSKCDGIKESKLRIWWAWISALIKPASPPISFYIHQNHQTDINLWHILTLLAVS